MRLRLLLAALVPLALSGCVGATALPAAELASSVYRGGVLDVLLEGEAPIDTFARAAAVEGCRLEETRAYFAVATCPETNVRIEAQALDERTVRLRGAAATAVARAISISDEVAFQTRAVADAMTVAGFEILSAERRRL